MFKTKVRREVVSELLSLIARIDSDNLHIYNLPQLRNSYVKVKARPFHKTHFFHTNFDELEIIIGNALGVSDDLMAFLLETRLDLGRRSCNVTFTVEDLSRFIKWGEAYDHEAQMTTEEMQLLKNLKQTIR